LAPYDDIFIISFTKEIKIIGLLLSKKFWNFEIAEFLSLISTQPLFEDMQ